MAAARLRLGPALVLSALCHGGAIAALASYASPPPPVPAYHSVSMVFVHPPLAKTAPSPEPVAAVQPQPKPQAIQRKAAAKPPANPTPTAPHPVASQTNETAEVAPQPVSLPVAAVETTTAPMPVIRDPDYLTPPVPPTYPPAARRLQIEGTVVVRALVERPGHPSQVTLWQSSGESLLDRSALEAVRGWRFRPMTHAGGTVAAWVEVPITFSMSNT